MKARIPNDLLLPDPDLLLGRIRDASGSDKACSLDTRDLWTNDSHSQALTGMVLFSASMRSYLPHAPNSSTLPLSRGGA